MDSYDYQKLQCDEIESVHIGKPLPNKKKSDPASEKKKRKRHRYTCLNVCLCMTLFSFGVMFLMVTAIYMAMIGFVQKYTVGYHPNLQLDTTDVPDWELDRFVERAEEFFQGLKDEEKWAVFSEEDFVIKEREVNGFVGKSDVLGSHVYAHLEEDVISLDVSMPVDFLPGGKGKYFVANQSLSWKNPSSLVLAITVFSEKTVDNAFSFSMNPDHAWYSYFHFNLKRENERIVLDLIDGRTSNMPSVEVQKDILAEIYESNDQDEQDFIHSLVEIGSISLEKGQITLHMKDGARRALASMDVSPSLFGGASRVARHLAGF